MSSRLMALILALAALALVVAACGGDDDDDGDGNGGGLASEFDLSGDQFTVGSKEFTEQLILGQITTQMLEATGADVTDQTGLEGSVAARNALTNGRVDMYWEYTGTAWATYFEEEEPVPDPQGQFDAVAETDLDENGIVWVEPFTEFNNTFALAIRSDSGSEELDQVETLSDLAALVGSNPDLATFCLGEEFSTRPDGFPGVERTYDFEAPEGNVSVIGDSVVYDQVANGDCNFGSVFATDGRIQSLDLRVLEDDQNFFPFFNVALNVRQQALDQAPQLEEIFAPIAEALTEEEMISLNAQVDVEGERPEDVAQQFLEDNGFTG